MPDSNAVDESPAAGGEPPAGLTEDSPPLASASFDGAIIGYYYYFFSRGAHVCLVNSCTSASMALVQLRSSPRAGATHKGVYFSYSNSVTSTSVCAFRSGHRWCGRNGISHTLVRPVNSNIDIDRAQGRPSRTDYPFFIVYSRSRGILLKNATPKPLSLLLLENSLCKFQTISVHFLGRLMPHSRKNPRKRICPSFGATSGARHLMASIGMHPHYPSLVSPLLSEGCRPRSNDGS